MIRQFLKTKDARQIDKSQNQLDPSSQTLSWIFFQLGPSSQAVLSVTISNRTFQFFLNLYIFHCYICVYVSLLSLFLSITQDLFKIIRKYEKKQYLQKGLSYLKEVFNQAINSMTISRQKYSISNRPFQSSSFNTSGVGQVKRKKRAYHVFDMF